MNQIQKIKKYYKECDTSYQHWGDEEIYNIHYGFWDKNTKSNIQSLENMNRVLAQQLEIKSGDKILDAGCGVGASSIWLAKNYDVKIVGITISELQCKKAQAFAKNAGVSEKVQFYVQDFTNTNFNKESFDIVWSIESVCHAINKKDFIKETKRILRNNGKLIITDGFIKKQYLNKLDKYFLNNWIKKWAISNLAEANNFKKELKEIGFKNIKFTDITNNILPASKEIFKRGIIGFPVYKLKRKNQIQMDHVKGCIFQYLALKKDIWAYGIFYAEK